VCASSTLGFYRGAPDLLRSTLRDMVVPRRLNRAAVHGFVEVLRSHRAEFGRLQVTSPIAALALEWLRLEDAWHPGASSVDTIALHRELWLEADQLIPDLVANQLDVCTHVVDTGVFVCARGPFSPGVFAGLATQAIPAVFVYAGLRQRGVTVRDREGGAAIELRDGAIVDGRLGALPRGTYELSMVLEPGGSPAVDRAQLLRLEVRAGTTIGAASGVPPGSREIAVRFEAPGGERLGFRVSTDATSAVALTGAKLRPVAAAQPAR